MRIKTIASGSKGNCSIILCGETNLIIDMGISYLTLKRSLEENSLSFDQITGILITHNHKDHVNGLASLIKKTKLSVYIPQEMYESIKDLVPKENCIFIEDKFSINDVEIELIHTSHDSPYSIGFIISQNEKSLVYITDTGYINRKYIQKMKNKDLYLIESNHDEKMLMDGPYPRFLKERVISDKGHLSNTSAAKYLEKVIGIKTKNIILAHISEKNNTETLAYECTKNIIKNQKIDIIIARQHEESPMIEV